MRTVDKATRLSRRRFLAASGMTAIGTVALSTGAVLIDPRGAWAMTVQALKPETAATLIQMARDIYPHDHLADTYYARAVEPYDVQAAADEAVRTMIEDGVAALDAKAVELHGAPYVETSAEGARVEVLTAVSEGDFFKKVRSDMITALYNQPEVWPKFGYEGPSAPEGGYLYRGFDDIDWLDTV